jgi:hypothetical protein
LEAFDHAIEVINSEHDPADPERIHRSTFRLSAHYFGRVEFVEFDPSVAVRRAKCRKRGPDILQTDKTIYRRPFYSRLALKFES